MKELTSEYDRWEFHAAAFLRHFLNEGALIAYVRDPETGAILRLISSEWGLWYNYPTRWFSFDYVHPYSFQPDPAVLYSGAQPAPEGTFIRDALRPVFFLQKEFDQWFAEVFSAKANLKTSNRRAGRPPGSGSWGVADDRLLDDMRDMIKSGKAKSPNDAARLLVDRAAGTGTPDSKQTRLANRYRKNFGPEKN